jgi:hypothetical protein
MTASEHERRCGVTLPDVAGGGAHVTPAEALEHRAGQLVISPLTAKTHVSNVLRKLDCHDRAALVALAYETGLITVGEPERPRG